MGEPQGGQKFRYIKIQLPSKCANCSIMGDFSGLQQKCGLVLFGPHLSTLYGKVATEQFENVIDILKKEFSAEEVSEKEYSDFSWSL